MVPPWQHVAKLHVLNFLPTIWHLLFQTPTLLQVSLLFGQLLVIPPLSLQQICTFQAKIYKLMNAFLLWHAKYWQAEIKILQSFCARVCQWYCCEWSIATKGAPHFPPPEVVKIHTTWTFSIYASPSHMIESPSCFVEKTWIWVEAKSDRIKPFRWQEYVTNLWKTSKAQVCLQEFLPRCYRSGATSSQDSKISCPSKANATSHKSCNQKWRSSIRQL